MILKKWFPLLLLLLGVFFLVGCADPNPLRDVPGADGSLAGFWSGLWHGLILPFSFVGSLFSDNISIYQVHNTGGWYNFGFLLGIGITFGGGGAST